MRGDASYGASEIDLGMECLLVGAMGERRAPDRKFGYRRDNWQITGDRREITGPKPPSLH